MLLQTTTNFGGGIPLSKLAVILLSSTKRFLNIQSTDILNFKEIQNLQLYLHSSGANKQSVAHRQQLAQQTFVVT